MTGGEGGTSGSGSGEGLEEPSRHRAGSRGTPGGGPGVSRLPHLEQPFPKEQSVP